MDHTGQCYFCRTVCYSATGKKTACKGSQKSTTVGLCTVGYSATVVLVGSKQRGRVQLAVRDHTGQCYFCWTVCYSAAGRGEPEAAQNKNAGCKGSQKSTNCRTVYCRLQWLPKASGLGNLTGGEPAGRSKQRGRLQRVQLAKRDHTGQWVRKQSISALIFGVSFDFKDL